MGRETARLCESAQLGSSVFSESDPVVLRGAAITLRVLSVKGRCAALRQVLAVLVAVLVTCGRELSAVHLTLTDIGPRIPGLGNGITPVRSIHDLVGRFHSRGQRLFTLRHGGLPPVELGLVIHGCSLWLRALFHRQSGTQLAPRRGFVYFGPNQQAMAVSKANGGNMF